MHLAQETSNLVFNTGSFVFPSSGYYSAKHNAWISSVQAWFYEESKLNQNVLLLKFLQSALGAQNASPTAIDVFSDRIKLFLAYAKRGKRILVRVGKRVIELGSTGKNGHLVQQINFTEEDLAYQQTFTSVQWLNYDFTHAQQNSIIGHTSFQFLGNRGVSVISDIDDTIKVSHVYDKKRLLYGTFFEEYAAVDGMSDLLKSWSAQGASFHYVSTTPWPLYKALVEFFNRSQFPHGTFHLKPFCWRDLSCLEMLRTPLRTKPLVIEQMLNSFPTRKFILLGDSSELDPEIYIQLAMKYPEQVKKILIRMVAGANRTKRQITELFGKISREKWQIFEDACELNKQQVKELNQTFY